MTKGHPQKYGSSSIPPTSALQPFASSAFPLFSFALVWAAALVSPSAFPGKL